MADWKGIPFRRVLISDDFLREEAILRGSFQVKTPSSKSKALLYFVMRSDQYLLLFFFIIFCLRYRSMVDYFSSLIKNKRFLN